MQSLIDLLAHELAAQPAQITAAVTLLDGGATVPFIARYRKEVTGGLDDNQLRLLEQRLAYLRELADRRTVIIASLTELGVLDEALHEAVLTATTKQRLEDVYLPYKPKRRTKAQIARESGLAPLAAQLLTDPQQEPTTAALDFVDANKGVADVNAALEGARQILFEQFAEQPELTGRLREWLWERGIVTAQVIAGKEQEGAKFADYFDYRELICTIPSHRALALFRGRNQGILTLDVLPSDGADADAVYQHEMAVHFGIANGQRPADQWLLDTVRKAWRIKLFTRLELDVKQRLLDAAETEAIRVFALNLKDLLLAAPAGRLATMGLDPGLRTGVKVAIVDNTGRVVTTATIYPHVPRNDWDGALAQLTQLARAHQVKLISIGNGTGGRETERLVRDLIRQQPELGLRALMVSEAGASVYSASEYAAHELPQLDVSLRGAVSIARRLQDPLAELVKIDPKAIGVGQYQHDVNQAGLARSLESVVEDCVNAVGVDVNTASIPLLARVSGLNANLAEKIVQLREQRGGLTNRRQLLDVPRLGAKTFEQCAGFLRINDGDEPLDASAVHPEAYPLVRRIVAQLKTDIRSLIGNRAVLRQLNPRTLADEQFGEPTVRDIVAELEKPGRDPRPEFRAAALQDGIETLADVQPGMILEGTVTNVANFGAFVDIGVHQDGLIHVSMLADHFVKDPRDVVKSGQVVRVKVVDVDQVRRRIALSLRLDEPLSPPAPRSAAPGSRSPAAMPTPGAAAPATTALASAFATARRSSQ